MEAGICFECSGTGKKLCTDCAGTGYRTPKIADEDIMEMPLLGAPSNTCLTCGGTGEITCPKCGGTGKELQEAV